MITGAQIRMARGYLRWSAKQLAEKARVAESTIKRMEQDEGFPVARGANIEAVYKTLIAAGIEFLEDSNGVGVRVSGGATRPPTVASQVVSRKYKPAVAKPALRRAPAGEGGARPKRGRTK
jgi:transcriptional regulator with XRE-family HTH domain